MTDNIAPFNYEGLTDDTQEFLRSRTEEIKKLAQRSAQDIRDIGIMLIEVKGRIGHGRFGLWLTAEFGWSDRTARSFMAVGDRFKTENFSDLNIAPSALYLLSAPSTSKTASDEAKKRAKTGEKITHSTAKGIVASHKPRVITPPAPPITVSMPELPWDEQYGLQIAAHPNEVVFVIPGPRATMWVALGQVAQLVAQKTGTQPARLAGRESTAIACVTITDPQTGKDDAAKVADLEELLGKPTVTYVESDAELLAMLRDTTLFTIEPTKILQARRDRELEEEAAAHKPFAAPIPGIPAQRTEPQFPEPGWRSLLPPASPAPVQPEMPLVIDMPGGEPEEPADVTDMQRAEALYAASQREKNADKPARPEDFEEWLIDGLMQRLDEVVRFSKLSMQFARTDEQQHLQRWALKQVEWSTEVANDKFRRIAAHNGVLLDLETDIERASTLSDINGVLSKLSHYKVGDEKLDMPVTRLAALAEAKLSEWKAEDDSAEGTIAA